MLAEVDGVVAAPSSMDGSERSVAVVVTVTQGVDPQDPPTHSQYDFTLTSST